MDKESSGRVAIIGAGNTAREHIRAFADIPGVILAGIHSRTRARAESLAAEFGIRYVCDSIPELYEKTAADLVVVTVLELAMNSVSRLCFEFPWTVLLEKPAGYNVADAEEIVAVARTKKRRVLVALNRRFHSSTRIALEDLDQDDSPRFVHVQDQEDLAAAAASGFPEAVVQNWMYANAIHVIDLLRVFGRGEITSVAPVFSWNPDKSQVVVAKIVFESGDLGIYEGIWQGPGPWSVSVNTNKKRWELRPLEKAAFQIWGSRQLNSVEMDIWDQEFKPGFRRQAETVLNYTLREQSINMSHLPTLEDALKTMYLIQKIFA